MKFYKFIFLIIICITFFGCATGSTIITGQVRPAIDPSEVRIYLEPPTQFETIGIIEASSDVEFSRQSAQDRVMNELRTRAAKIGANGILLTGTGTESSSTGGFFIDNFFYATTTKTITAQGRAIFVNNE